MATLVAQRARARLGDSLLMIAITGYGQSNDREHALASGFDAHATKPLRVDVLQHTLARARNGRAAATR